jgi:hypothetical protein
MFDPKSIINNHANIPPGELIDDDISCKLSFKAEFFLFML